MKKIILSPWYWLYAIISIIYTAVTYFPLDFKCLQEGTGGFCGVFTGILNLPALVIMFPFSMLKMFNPGPDQPWSSTALITYYILMVMGWLILGAIVGWVISKMLRRGTSFNSIKFEKGILTFHIIGIVLILGKIFSAEGLFVFLAIPIMIITIPALMVRLYQSLIFRNYSKMVQYLLLILLPFVCLGLVTGFWSIF